ncbi:hypothetical protein ACH4F6_37580 [Streptomyces sp. NPDC017936]|uniref:hypothetical protein n=1 Tax=Streptomyces sp. NPDC017936 TaxID=3365016 RepID=UPI00378E8D58
MTTTLERLATGERHDPEILLPNTYSTLLHTVETRCPCGSTASVRDGLLGTHEPRKVWDANGTQMRAVIRDAYGVGATCRYSGRTVTLAAALERDNALTPAERHARDVTVAWLEAGIVNKAPAGYALPKPVAALFALAEANGWTTAQAWAPGDDGFLLNLRVGRPGGWQYDLSYFVAPGVARRTRFGLCHTPERLSPHDTPSLKAITAAIRANPVEG